MKKADVKSPLVNCAYDRLDDPAALKLNPKNPNRHGPDQLRVYQKILVHQGFRKAVVVSKQSGLVVTGAGLVLTARANGWPKVPVDEQDFKSPADEYAHMLADNKLPQMSEMDEELVGEILRDEIGANLDHELAGVLTEPGPATELKPLPVQAPPKMAWVLIGIPLVRFSEINQHIEQIAKLDGVKVESTVNDQVKI